VQGPRVVWPLALDHGPGPFLVWRQRSACPRWVGWAISTWTFLWVVGLLVWCSEGGSSDRVFVPPHHVSIPSQAVLTHFCLVRHRLQHSGKVQSCESQTAAQYAHLNGVQRLLVTDGHRRQHSARDAFKASRHAAVEENTAVTWRHLSLTALIFAPISGDTSP